MPECISVHHTYAGVPGGQKMALSPLEVESQVFVNHVMKTVRGELRKRKRGEEWKGRCVNNVLFRWQDI